jgi:hypothetical protein
MATTTRPYEAVPPEAAAVLRPALPGLADEMIAAIAREVPGYARAMEGEFGQMVRLGVEVALNRFVDLLADPEPDAASARRTYVDLGRGEFHSGRSLDALLAAYRVGARLSWRRFVEAGVAGGLTPDAIYALGEAIFAYIDELSAESAEGYAEEQSAAAGESERRRRRLVRVLTQDPPAGQEAIRTAAAAAGWPLPRGGIAALVAATAGDGSPARRCWTRSPPAWLGGSARARSAPRRSARRWSWSRTPTLRAAGAACTRRPPTTTRPSRSARPSTGGSGPRARGARSLPTAWPRRAGSPPAAATAVPPRRPRPPPVDRCGGPPRRPAGGGRSHVAADLAASRLAGRSTTSPRAARRPLRETLAAWLDRPRQVPAVAAALGVPSPTVRYPRPPAARSLRGALDDSRPRASSWRSRYVSYDALLPIPPMRLLLTGAAGMLGHDLRASAERAGHDVTPLGRAELDVRDAAAVRAAVAAARPDAVINCAAWTDVDGAEADEAAATALNGAAAGHVAAAAADAGAFAVQMSTDYVFDGTSADPYTESAPPAPRSAYGRSKLAGERAVAAAAPGAHAIVRTAWLFGRHGGNFVATMRGSRAGARTTITVGRPGRLPDSPATSPAPLGDRRRRTTGILHARRGRARGRARGRRSSRAGGRAHVPGRTADLAAPRRGRLLRARLGARRRPRSCRARADGRRRVFYHGQSGVAHEAARLRRAGFIGSNFVRCACATTATRSSCSTSSPTPAGARTSRRRAHPSCTARSRTARPSSGRCRAARRS